MVKIIPLLPCAELYIKRATAALETQNYQKAIHDLKIGLSLTKNTDDQGFIVSQLAVVYENLGEYQKALDILQVLPQHAYHVLPQLSYFMADAYYLLADTRSCQFYLNQYLGSGDSNYLEEAQELQEALEGSLDFSK